MRESVESAKCTLNCLCSVTLVGPIESVRRHAQKQAGASSAPSQDGPQSLILDAEALGGGAERQTLAYDQAYG
jgi:hypothetical protein